MTMKYSRGNEVRITEDVDVMVSALSIPERDAAQVAGKVGTVTQVAPSSNLPYRVDVPDVDYWWFREQDLSPANGTSGEETTSEPAAELAAFKARVVEVATRYAREHNMCSVIDSALTELGLERARTRYTFTVTVDVPATARVDTLRSDVHRVIVNLIESDEDWDGIRFVRPDGDRYASAVQATLVE